MTMIEPKAFREFALYCLDLEGENNDLDAIFAVVRRAYQRLPRHDQEDLLDFLNGLLVEGAHTDEELRDIWWGSGARFIFFSGVRGFLKHVRDMLAQEIT